MKIKSIEKFKNVLDNIVINEEQKTALHEFFSEFSNILKEKIKEEVLLENESKKEEYSQENFDALFEEKLIIVKKQWEEEKAAEFETLKNSLQEEYAGELSSALEELYESVELKVKVDLAKTKEFVALEAIKGAILPLINNEDTHVLAKQVTELRKEKEILESFLHDNKRQSIIEDLIEDFEPKKAEIIREFLEKCADEEEIYETFNRVVAIFEIKEEEKNENEFNEEEEMEDDSELLNEEEEEEESDEEEDEADEESDEEEDYELELDEEEEEVTAEETTPIVDIKTKRNEKLQMFSESEQEILKKAKFF